MKLLLLVLLFIGCSSISFINCQTPDDGILFQTFVNWMDNYEIYYTSGDMQAKFQSWKENLLKIADLNANINTPDVEFKVEEGSIETAAMRTLLAEPVVSVSYPSADVAKFELNQFSDLSQAEFSSIYAGADVSLAFPEVVAAATLSTGAIVGIAIGGAAAVIGAAAATTYIIKKKRNSPKGSKISSPDVKLSNKPAQGIDIMNLDPNKNAHKSITARAFYTTDK